MCCKTRDTGGRFCCVARHGDGSPVSRYFKRENSNYPEYYVYDPNGRLQAIAAVVNLSLDGKHYL